MSMSSSLELYHNKGEQDAVNRFYDPPHALGASRSEKQFEENGAYDQGYFHTLGQIHQGDGHYDPPIDLGAKGAYDEGWKAAENS